MSTNATAEADRAAEVVPAVEPRAPWRVREIRVVEHGVLNVRFVDDTEGRLDMGSLLNGDKVIGTVFEPLRDASLFAQAAINLGTVEWPGEIDLAPDAMYDEIRANGVCCRLNAPLLRAGRRNSCLSPGVWTAASRDAGAPRASSISLDTRQRSAHP